MFNDDAQLVLTVKDLQLKFYVSPTTAKTISLGWLKEAF